MEDKNTIEFPNDGSQSKASVEKKDVLSEDISLSQLEMMANKKKLNKKSAEFSVSQFAASDKDSKDNVKKKKTESSAKKQANTSSVSSSLSSDDKDRSKRKQKHVIKENNNEGTRKEKCEFLYKLEKLGTKRRISKMDMNNTLDELRNEYERISNEMKTERSVGFFKRMLLLGVQGIEMVNNKFDPLGVDLDGWSEAMGYSLENQEYDEVMADLYEKYKGAGQMSPEMKLVFMIISSATMFTISKKISKMDTSSAFTNIIGSFMGQQATKQAPQQVRLPSETSEDIRPSRMKGPSDGIDIENILKTMKERKQEKEMDVSEVSDEVFKSIPLNTQKKGRGRPKKNAVL